ncbi:MAG: hypothetical protein A2939_04165 [Parcubacteria group bacterium RIFCSPLOWO2_01_FULL_48_18]|nr:MAG: hypothetical protein A2939_04165 [Parcubacteria group bacterium RIFCSPLOWO2_01_FULL_48_18]OHB24436.1 MAG: hypothetical protein A3J67_02255 [Parcubacteria group bacterium RIFCSPHIGHO2_02_FULL_48_10b]
MTSLKTTHYLIAAGVLLIIIGAVLIVRPGGGTQTPAGEESGSSSASIAKDATEIFNDEEALRAYVKTYGSKQTLLRLHELSLLYGSCHTAAHKAGRISYEIYGDKSFRLCSSECHSGCYHGATEAYFKEHGTANLVANLQTLCGSELNAFFSHQCIHGIGHGLMAWTNYELFDALTSCDELERQQDSCWTGVFMENIVGGLNEEEGHATQFLNEDPLYPCTIVDDKYKFSCYFLQTSRMTQLYGSDFSKVASACLKAPEQYQRHCFESMGRDVGGTHRGNAEREIADCSYAPAGASRVGCVIGAVQDSFWDPTGQNNALAFCRLLTEKEEKDACYRTIFARAPQVLVSVEEVKHFCARAEEQYHNECLSFAH